MVKNLINLWKAFMDEVNSTGAEPADICVYQALLYFDNNLMFREWFACTNARLESFTGLSKNTIVKAKNRLKQRGLIDFKVSGKASTLYRLCEPYRSLSTQQTTQRSLSTQDPMQDPTQDPTQNPTQNPTQDPTQDPTHIIRQDKTRQDLPEEGVRVCEDVPVISPQVKQAFEQTFRPVLPQDLDRLSAMVRDYGELSMVSAIRAAKERGGRPPVREPLSWLGKVLRTRLSQTQTQAEREEEYQPPECRAPNPFIGMSREEYLDKCRRLYGKETFERMMRDGQI